MPNTREKLIELLKLSDACICNLCGEKGSLDRVAGVIAENLIANGVTVQKWIPVTERLPEESGDYLVITYNGFIERLSYSERHNAFNTDDRLMYAECAIPCTHWMPLPEPPKGE